MTSLAIFMICKNEEKHIGRAIRSVLPCADHIVVVDTGSTDGTKAEALRASGNVPIYFETFTDASERDESGDWKLWDFARARNRAADIAEALGTDWAMWMDADDELQEPAKVKRALLRDDVDTFAIFVESGGMKWLHQRLWKTAKHVRFKGRVHEYPVIDGLRSQVLYTTIRHDLEPIATQENSNPRNLRILMREWQENPDGRTAFYIACTHRDGGRHAEAIEWFHRRIAFGEGDYRDEYLFALLYLAREISATGDQFAAEQCLTFARAQAADWQEFTMELANVHYRSAHHDEAIAVALDAFDKPITPSALWREPGDYRDRPARLISWCHEHAGRLGDAVAWARMAADRIGNVDPDWNARIERLQSQYVYKSRPAPAVITGRQKIALLRPGAIGDILMTLNLIPSLRALNPGVDIHYFCAPQFAKPDALMSTMLAAGVDAVLDASGLGAWRKSYERVVRLVGYPLEEGYPDKPMRQHLLDYFAWEMGLSVNLPRDGLPQLTLRLPQRPPTLNAPRQYATLQTRAGWSKYKEWNDERWSEVVRRAGVQFVQIGEASTPTLPGALRFTGTLAETIAVVANADFHVGIDSFANHLTNYLWQTAHGARRVRGVILWGSTQASAAGYPDNINISRGLSCQPCFRENPAISANPRGACINPPRLSYDDPTPHACMAAIAVEDVIAAIDLMQRA